CRIGRRQEASITFRLSCQRKLAFLRPIAPPEEWPMSFEANKIAAAVLVAMILAMVSGILADKLVKPTMLAKNVYQVAGAAPEEEASAAAKPAGPEPIGPLLASA